MATKASNAAKPARKEAKHGRLAVFQAAAIDDSRISPNQLAVLAALSTHSSRSGFVDVSHGALAARLGVKRQYIQRTLAYLEQLGYLRSARRKRSSDQGETTKAYKLELDYALPVAYWRYVPTDYGSEPEEIWPEALLSSSPPATREVAPPATREVAPPATIQVAPRTLGINVSLLEGVEEGAQARENDLALPSSPFLERIRAAAHLPPSTNMEALEALMSQYTALLPDDLLIAASDCADWYAIKQSRAPRLGNLAEWLRREARRRKQVNKEEEAQEEQKEEANTHATRTTATATDGSAAAADGSAQSRARGARASKRRASGEAGRAPADQGGSAAALAADDGSSEWKPGHRVYIADEPGNDDCEWYTVITETGKRIRYSTVSGYANREEAYG